MEEVTWKYNKKTHNIKIKNSLLIQDRKEMIEFLKQVPLEKVNRTLKSAVNEWIAHNRLYKLGLYKEHCRECDITKDEALRRRIIYWLLSRW